MQQVLALPQSGYHPVSSWMVWLGASDRDWFVKRLRRLGIRPTRSFDLVLAEDLLEAIRQEESSQTLKGNEHEQRLT